MNDLLLFWSNVLLVLLEVIVLVFFASVFFKKNLSRRKFGASVILLAISNITALALLDSHFWSKAFAVIIVDAELKNALCLLFVIPLIILFFRVVDNVTNRFHQ